jgi:hypothetical protein
MTDDEDDDYAQYLAAYIQAGLEEGREYFRALIRPLFARKPSGRATMGEYEELAARDPDEIRRMLT